MAFEFTNANGNMVSIESNPADLITYRFADEPLPWYNGSDKEAETISKVNGISYPKLMELRRSPEFKEVAEEYLENNGYEVNKENLEQAGILGEKRQIVKYPSDAKKIVLRGYIMSEDDETITVQKARPVEDEFIGKTKKDLINMILEARSADRDKGDGSEIEDLDQVMEDSGEMTMQASE